MTSDTSGSGLADDPERAALAAIEPAWRIPDGAGRHLGIGIVGCGGIVSGAHLPAYRAAGLRVVAVHDVDEEKARRVAAEFGIGRVAGSAEELVATPGVDIVDIAVPPWEQPRIVALVTTAGKHMLCQKPLALDYGTAVAEVEDAEAAGVLLAVNQQMRWDAGVAAARDLVRRGVLGRVAEAQVLVSVATPWHMWPWLAAAPRLEVTYHSIHYLDSLRSILGDPAWVTSVHGRDPEQAPVVGETMTRTVLEYADGSSALVAVNHYNRHGEPNALLRVLGTEATLEGTIGLLYDYPHGRPDTLSLYRDGREVRAYGFDTSWLPDAFLGPMADLMDAIATGRRPVTSGRDNLGTIAVVAAAYRSAEERRSVRLDEITGPRP
jgi:predicted dehydrogenase